MITSGTDTRRLFYALWPDQDTSDQLRERQHNVAGRLTHPADFHMTLVFLGMQPVQCLPQLYDVLLSLDSVDIRLVLDKYDAFPRKHIVWLGMTSVPTLLLQLQQRLVQALVSGGVVFNQEPQFTPHVTLARKSELPANTAFAPIHWRADKLALVESIGGGKGSKYRVLAHC